jgi:hypothetical protein
MPELYQTEKKPMTEGDRLRVSGEHAKSQLELETLKEEKRDVSSMYRVKIRELEEKIHTLAVQLDEGAFELKFEVIEEPDDARLMIDIKRRDTGERVNTRPMTEAEKEAAQKRKQRDLFPDGEGDTEPPPPNVRNLRSARGSAGRSKKKNGRR